jgi:hypothetical protein
MQIVVVQVESVELERFQAVSPRARGMRNW